MHPNKKRATENRRLRAASLRYVVTAANQWVVSGYQWMHTEDQGRTGADRGAAARGHDAGQRAGDEAD